MSSAFPLIGYRAGPDQNLDHPLGRGGTALHQWAFATRTFGQMHGMGGGATGPNDDFVARGIENLGAWILGRNMFGPTRSPRINEAWKGWWETTRPTTPRVFVLTHHPRKPLVMEGGTTFHSVTDGIHAALELATRAAGGRDIRLSGGVATIRQYLQAGFVDEVHLALSPHLLGSGESLLAGLDLVKLGCRSTGLPIWMKWPLAKRCKDCVPCSTRI